MQNYAITVLEGVAKERDALPGSHAAAENMLWFFIQERFFLDTDNYKYVSWLSCLVD